MSLEARRGKLREDLQHLRDAIVQTPRSSRDELLWRMIVTIGDLADVGNQQVEVAHERLTLATKRLSIATWVLAVVTLALIALTVAEWFHVVR